MVDDDSVQKGIQKLDDKMRVSEVMCMVNASKFQISRGFESKSEFRFKY